MQKNKIQLIIMIIFIVILTTLILLLSKPNRNKFISTDDDNIIKLNDKIICNEKDSDILNEDIFSNDWEIFIEALTWVESRHQDSIVNKSTDATGQFQITPIFIKEANRLQKSKVYKLSDRFNYSKSREMFDIIQNIKNPKRDKKLACRIHYGSYSKAYYNSVMNKYYILIENKKQSFIEDNKYYTQQIEIVK